MKRILLIFLALTLLLLSACTEQPDIASTEIHTSNVISKKIAEYGDYLYVVEDRLIRYNRKTGEMRPLCTDPDCYYECVFCSVPMEITQVTDGRLYFNGTFVRTRENFFAYVDLVTEEATVLMTLPKNGTSILSPPVLNDGWLYYTAHRLQDGGDAKNPDDYDFCVERMPMDGGEGEFVCKIENNIDEKIYAVLEENVITVCSDVFYTTNAETGERKVLFDPEDYGFVRYINVINYLDGYFYCLIYTDDFFKSEYYPGALQKSYLLKINAKTGEMKQLIEEPIYGLTVTDDTIYYSEQMIRTIYVPDDYQKHPEKVALTGLSDTVYACDLDGGNRREVYSNPYLDLHSFNRIIDNCLYGWIYEYDETAHKMSERFFGKVDFSTGEVTAATRVK